MHWVVQENLYKEVAFIDLINGLEKCGATYDVVKVVPFSHELIPEPTVDRPVIVMGATTMIGIAQERGWRPGAFYNDNFNHDKWLQVLGRDLLNSDGFVCRFADIECEYSPFFVRPLEDRKVFSGQVIDKANFEIWKRATDQADYSGYTTLTPDTKVVVSPVKAIHREWRFFVVDGEIVTGSLYKSGDRVIHMPLIPGEDAEAYAEGIAKKWQPDVAFVVDVALTDEGYKVIEYNCLNSSGFYKADVSKLVDKLNSLSL